MLTRLNLIAILTLGFSLSSAMAAPQEQGTAITQVPARTTIALRIASLKKLDTHLKPLAKQFGLSMPELGQFVAELEGVDSDGELIVGLVQTNGRELAPYVLLPILDYKAFVHACDGDAGMTITPLTLAGEELMATRRGDWALVTNPLENYQFFEPIAGNAATELSGFTESDLLSVVVTKFGIQHLRTIASTRSESSYQRANRYRALKRQINPTTPMDLEIWESLVYIYSNVVKRWSQDVGQLMVAINVKDDRSISLRFEAPQTGNKDFPASKWSTSAFAVPNQQTFLSGGGPWGSPWTNEFVQMYLDHFEVSSYDYGISYLRPTEFRNYRASATKLTNSIRGAQFTVINPAKGKPVYSNSALVLDSDDSKVVMENLDEAVNDWNRLIESSQRQLDFHLGIEAIKVGQREGKRFTLDLTDAMRKNDIADVRILMDKLFGRNGMWTVDALPLDENRVLLSDLPDDLRDQLIASLESAEKTDTDQSEWLISADPQRMQEWRNQSKRVELGEKIIGWKPKSLDCDSNLEIRVTTHEEKLSVRIELAADVVAAAAKLWNAKQ